jgi:hypothetical protein
MGQEILEPVIGHDMSVDISSLEAGFYYFYIYGENRQTTLPFIKMNK